MNMLGSLANSGAVMPDLGLSASSLDWPNRMPVMLVNSSDCLANNSISNRAIGNLDLMANKPAMQLVNCIHMVTWLDCLVNQANRYAMVTILVTNQMHLMHQMVRSSDHLESCHLL